MILKIPLNLTRLLSMHSARKYAMTIVMAVAVKATRREFFSDVKNVGPEKTFDKLCPSMNKNILISGNITSAANISATMSFVREDILPELLNAYDFAFFSICHLTYFIRESIFAWRLSMTKERT